MGYFDGIDFDISPDEKYMAIRTPNRVLIFNINSQFIEHEIECSSPTYAKFITNEDLKIYYSGKMHYWNLKYLDEELKETDEPDLNEYKFS